MEEPGESEVTGRRPEGFSILTGSPAQWRVWKRSEAASVSENVGVEDGDKASDAVLETMSGRRA